MSSLIFFLVCGFLLGLADSLTKRCFGLCTFFVLPSSLFYTSDLAATPLQSLPRLKIDNSKLNLLIIIMIQNK